MNRYDEEEHLPAIPTVWREQLYRSRLEARAALWLESHGVPFKYEPERATKGYLPDFVLPQQQVIFECKGKMRARDEEKLQQAARDAAEVGWQLFMWQGFSWGRIKAGNSLSVIGRYESQAYLCAQCLQWTWRHQCDTCGSPGPYVAEHQGRTDKVKIPAYQMGEFVCEIGRKSGLKYKEVTIDELADVAIPEGFDPKAFLSQEVEEDEDEPRIEELLTEPKPCRYFASDEDDE